MMFRMRHRFKIMYQMFKNKKEKEMHTLHTIPKITYTVKAAIRSALEKLNPVLTLVKFPVFVSKERSVPSPTRLVPITPEKLTTGFAVKPTLVLIAA